MRKLKTRRRNYLSSGIHSKDSVTGPGTIISAMETIVVASGDSELSDESYVKLLAVSRTGVSFIRSYEKTTRHKLLANLWCCVFVICLLLY